MSLDYRYAKKVRKYPNYAALLHNSGTYGPVRGGGFHSD